MDKKLFRKYLLELYQEYTEYLIQREEEGRGRYDDNDFTFDKFMSWIKYDCLI